MLSRVLIGKVRVVLSGDLLGNDLRKRCCQCSHCHDVSIRVVTEHSLFCRMRFSSN